MEQVGPFKLVAQKSTPAAPEMVGQYLAIDEACRKAQQLVKEEKYLEAFVLDASGDKLYTITNRIPGKN
jgi:hypothetical protein